MLKIKDIHTLFFDFCEQWHYIIEDYREDIGFLILKHKIHPSDWVSYIHIDFYEELIRVYSTYKGAHILYSDVLDFEEMRDLYSVIFKAIKLNDEYIRRKK